MNSQINLIIKKVFDHDPEYFEHRNLNQTQIKRIKAIAKAKCLTYSNDEIKSISESLSALEENRALCIVGPNRSGKQTLINLLVHDLLQTTPIYFNPNTTGSFRELYGVTDPLAIQQLSANHQLGLVKYPIFETIVREVIKSQSVLVLTCDFSDPIIETFIPYFEGGMNGKHPKSLALPNGVAMEIQKPI